MVLSVQDQAGAAVVTVSEPWQPPRRPMSTKRLVRSRQDDQGTASAGADDQVAPPVARYGPVVDLGGCTLIWAPRSRGVWTCGAGRPAVSGAGARCGPSAGSCPHAAAGADTRLLGGEGPGRSARDRYAWAHCRGGPPRTSRVRKTSSGWCYGRSSARWSDRTKERAMAAADFLRTRP